jgi:protein gp37
MNRTKIDWTQYSWNPVTGCRHGCSFCYAREIVNRFPKAFPKGFEPTFHPERLEEPAKVKKPAHIFTVSMGDLFGDWVPEEWISGVCQAMGRAPQHTYTVLTKNPRRLGELAFLLPSELPHLFVGTSISGLPPDENYLLEGQLSSINYLCGRKRVVPNGVRTILSIEPMLGPLHPDWLPVSMDWLIIGGQTGRKPFQPPREWVEPLIAWARKWRVPVFVKDNCGLPDMAHEYPVGVPRDD